MAYDINYDDKRFTDVNAEKEAALTESEQTYDNMIKESEDLYKAQIESNKQWADKQSQLQQEQTDFAIEKIEQQKEQTQKDYIKEQSGAYADYQKQVNPYGVNAEQIASMGMQNTGYSESSKVAMYNKYQNRVAAARESKKLADLNYDNMIKDAHLQNSSVLAQIALNAYEKEVELSLQGMQYKNSLLLDKANKKMEIDNMYHNRWQEVLAQINHENALAEQIRQYNESKAFQREQFNWQKAQANKISSGGSGSGGGISKVSSSSSGKVTGIRKLAQASNKATKKANSSSELTVDYDSLMNVGYTASSQSYCEQLIADGVLALEEKNGKLVFVEGPNYMSRIAYNQKKNSNKPTAHTIAESGNTGLKEKEKEQKAMDNMKKAQQTVNPHSYAKNSRLYAIG